MTIKNILVAYSGKAARGSGLRHAVKLAKHHDAWLTGVLAHERSSFERRLIGRVPDDVIDTIRQTEKDQIAAAISRFNDTVAENWDTDRAEFIDLVPYRDGTLAELARCYDLVVTGVHSDESNEQHMSARPDEIALQSGRPVLVVPNGYESDSLADHALVAWDGKRSAARAIDDAMESLQSKAKVTVLTIGPHKPEPRPGGGIMTHLQRHGISATHLHKPKQKSIAETIESTAEELSAKLIVMGAFEHSKFSQELFGGVTTEILKTVKIPVFMSH